MTKSCEWCSQDIHEEDGSLEIRKFRKTGKDCYYFCNEIHLILWLRRRIGEDKWKIVKGLWDDAL